MSCLDVFSGLVPQIKVSHVGREKPVYVTKEKVSIRNRPEFRSLSFFAVGSWWLYVNFYVLGIAFYIFIFIYLSNANIYPPLTQPLTIVLFVSEFHYDRRSV